MPARPLADDILREPFWLGLAFLLIAGTAILGALAFQHLGGYQPCALCLMQRTPYYFGIPLAAAAVLASRLSAPKLAVGLLFGFLALLMIYNSGLAAYHAGVEWKFWEGPASCAPTIGVENAADMLNQLQSAHAPSCTDAPWRMLGLSFAGWNVLISGLLAVLAAMAAFISWRRASETAGVLAS
jgi:disulfide bond formation protein DsbB